jgi:hypothetical protein
MQNVAVKVEGNKLVIEVDLTKELGPSSSGKTILIVERGERERARPRGHEVRPERLPEEVTRTVDPSTAATGDPGPRVTLGPRGEHRRRPSSGRSSGPRRCTARGLGKSWQANTRS